MCGRYVTPKTDGIGELYGVDLVSENLPPRNWNARPSFSLVEPAPPVPAVVSSEKTGAVTRRLEPAFWSLIPSWARELPRNTFNARSEGAAAAATWRGPLKSHRAIFPASAYFESQGTGKKAKRYAFQDADERVLPLAGLWSWWRETPDAPWLLTAAILTIESPNEEVAAIHHRSPLVLTPDLIDPWLDPKENDGAGLLSVAVNHAAQRVAGLRHWEVARIEANDEQMLHPVAPG